MSEEETVTAEVQEATPVQPEHIGFGRYKIPGVDKTFETRAAAEAYLAAARALSEEENEVGDIVPKNLKITDHSLIYRHSIMELPMNERYLPDGNYSPFYDREYLWAWGRLDSLDISTKRAKGYTPVTLKELQATIKSGKCPEHYESLLQVDGQYLVYGDAVLLRMPRVQWREQQAAKEAQARALVAKTDKENLDNADNANIPLVGAGELPVKNDLRTGLSAKL